MLEKFTGIYSLKVRSEYCVLQQMGHKTLVSGPSRIRNVLTDFLRGLKLAIGCGAFYRQGSFQVGPDTWPEIGGVSEDSAVSCV